MSRVTTTTSRLRDHAGAVDDPQALLEAQRQALARDIHDAIGGALAAAHIDLNWLARHPAAAEAPERLRSAQEAVKQAIDATQSLVQGLYPPDLADGLMPALRRMAASFRQRTGIPTTLTAALDLALLPPGLQLAAYRTVQECLTNIAKHAADCSAVDITLEGQDGALSVTVRDDGRGIGAPVDAEASFGLRGLADRAAVAGGRLDIDTLPGGGTAVSLSVPFDTEAAQ